MKPLSVFERARFLHRAWRYRLRSEKTAIAHLLSRDLHGKTVVDIGANRGIYSYWMHRKVGTAGQVIAFEPQPELCDQLHQLRSSFGLGNLYVERMGLSSSCGELTLERPRSHWGGASFEHQWSDRHNLNTEVDLIKSRVTTLDTYFGNHSARPLAFLKCDVEGHELEVFRGGRNVLMEDRPELLFECHDACDPVCEVFELLQGLGYEGFCFANGGLAPVSEYQTLLPKIHKRAKVDFVFAHRERLFGLPRAA